MPMSSSPSKFAGTAVLTISLLSLQWVLWYFRPNPTRNVTPLNSGDRVVNIHGGNRKLLDVNFSLVSDQQLSSDHLRHDAHGSTNDHRKLGCSSLHHLNGSENRCHFVKSTNSCEMSEGFIQYIRISYCLFSTDLPLALVLLFLWLVFLFITVGLTADDYFCPSLQVISKTLRISQNIAPKGVTFLAIGNGAPDIFSALAAFSNSRDTNVEQLGIQALFGAGMFVTTVVVAVISFVSTVTLTTRPFTRDVLFYLGAVSWMFIVLYEENITFEEAIGFIVFYVVYILVVIIGHYIYQRWKRKVRVQINSQSSESEYTGDYLGSQGKATNLVNAAMGVSSESFDSANVEPTDLEHRDTLTREPHKRVSDALFASENTLLAPTIHSAPIPARHESQLSDEELPLLVGTHQVSAWRKFLQGLQPIDREDWRKSNWFWKFFLIVKAPAVFCLNLTVPVVDYDKEHHNWNKWLNVLHCITMPVFSVMATKANGIMVGGRFPAWALALCGGIVLALIVAMTTRSDKQPWGHFLFAYLAFATSVIWIYTTANEIVNLLRTFGVAFDLSDAILGLTFLAWGNSLGDLITNTAMARQGFSRMAVSACFGGPLLNMLLGIGISCTVVTASRGHAISLSHRSHQYQISAGFLAASLSSSAIIIPLMGFKVPRIYGVYLIVLYVTYLTVSIVAEIEQI